MSGPIHSFATTPESIVKHIYTTECPRMKHRL
jgi:hypothetical protein